VFLCKLSALKPRKRLNLKAYIVSIGKKKLSDLEKNPILNSFQSLKKIYLYLGLGQGKTALWLFDSMTRC
jgi:hypothetical protein